MSAETKADMEAAIARHFADEFDGALVTDWVMMTYGTSLEDEHGRYMREWRTGQPVHVTSGLLEYASTRHAYYMEESMLDDEDDDD